MNPSGQSSHKKEILFLFLYDWQELLNVVYRIYASCSQEDVWKAFYSTAEKPEETQENQGLEPSVATSQQTEEEQVEEESETEENESQIEENDNDLEENDPETEEIESEEDEESETGNPEETQEAAVVDEQTEGDEISSLVERIAEESMDIARLLKKREVRTATQYGDIAEKAKTLVKHIATLIKLVR